LSEALWQEVEPLGIKVMLVVAPGLKTAAISGYEMA